MFLKLQDILLLLLMLFKAVCHDAKYGKTNRRQIVTSNNFQSYKLLVINK